MMKYPESNTLVVRKVYKDHKDSTFTQLKWAIKRLGVENSWEAKMSPLEIIYKPTGQKILFRGLDDPMSITSIVAEVGYLCWCWIEEAFQISAESDFNMIDGSIRGLLPDALYKQITLTLNPWNEKHWIKQRFFDNPHEDIFTLQTNYMCNEFLDGADRQFFEAMKISSPRRYYVEGLGNWGQAEGLIFDDWSEIEFDYREIMKDKPYIESGFGLDFGYTTDPTGFVMFLIDNKLKEIYIYDESYEKGMLNNDIARMITRKGCAKEMIIADSAEPKSIAEIRSQGIPRIKGARKGKDSIKNGIQFLQQFKINIHPRCTNTILEFNNYAWETKNGRQINEPVDGYNHIIDPLRYACERFSRPSKVRLLQSRRGSRY
jgi:phage terminase large subunit